MKIKPTHVTLLLAGSLTISLFSLLSLDESKETPTQPGAQGPASTQTTSVNAPLNRSSSDKAKAKAELLSRLGKPATKDPLSIGNSPSRVLSAPVTALRTLPKNANAQFNLGEKDLEGTVMLNTPADEQGNWLMIISLDDLENATLKVWNDQRYGMGGTITNPQGTVAYELSASHDGLEYEIKNVEITDIVCGTDPAIGAAGTHAVPAAELTDTSSIEPPQDEVAYSSTLTLQSLPGSPNTLYLDFDGETISGTSWNGGQTINAAASRLNSDSYIRHIWRAVTEDYLPFNINVTTDRSVYDATPSTKRMMVIFTDTYSWYGNVAGTAYRGSFGSSYAPCCWVFTQNYDYLFRANTASHESGHTMGLSHDGSSTSSYYSGHSGTTADTSWRPIMGTTTRSLVTWDNGSYSGANNKEDDLSVIANRVGTRPNNASTIAPLTVDESMNIATEGSILMGSNNRPEASDIYSFSCGTGTATFNLNNYPLPSAPSNNNKRSNLDLQLEILDASGNVVLSDYGVDKTTATVTGNLTAGNYQLRVTTTAAPDPKGYPTYGQMGEYSITGNLPVEPFTLSPVALLNEVSFGSSADSQTITLSHKDSSSMAVTATSSAAWLNVTPDSFNSTSGSNTNMTVSFDSTSLDVGIYNESITVTVGTNDPVIIPVSFEVKPLGNYDGITIPASKAGVASTYPSSFDMPAAVGSIEKVTVLLDGVSHTAPKDLQVLLVSPAGKSVMLLDGNGGSTSISSTKLTFSSDGQNLPSTLTSGTYLPSGPDGGTTSLPSPAPAGIYSADLNSLNGDTPSGNWKLYVNDVAAKNGGSINGWTITIQTGEETLIATNYTQVDGSTSSISFQATPGKSYTVESSLDMSSWQTETQLTATTVNNTVTVSTSESSRRFFRVRENS